MYPENPEGTQVGSLNMGYIYDTARNRTHNLFRPKWEPISLGHRGGFVVKPEGVSNVFLTKPVVVNYNLGGVELRGIREGGGLNPQPPTNQAQNITKLNV